MKRISIRRLREIGFEPEYKSKWWNGCIFVTFYPNDKLMEVFVSARNTGSEDYARPASGVKNEKDLMDLCKLVNGLNN